METMKKDKGQIILLGVIVISILIISTSIYLNAIIINDERSTVNSGINEREIIEVQENAERTGNIAASGDSTGTPTSSETNYLNHMENYTRILNKSQIFDSIFNTTPTVNNTSWAIGQKKMSEMTNESNSKDWIMVEGVSDNFKARLTYNSSASTGMTSIKGYSSNEVPNNKSDWKWIINISSSSVQISANSGTSSCQVSGVIRIEIIENKTRTCDAGGSLNTFATDYQGLSSFYVENGDNNQATFDFRFDSGSSPIDLCSGNPCESEISDSYIYEIGVVQEANTKFNVFSDYYETSIRAHNTADQEYMSLNEDNIKESSDGTENLSDGVKLEISSLESGKKSEHELKFGTGDTGLVGSSLGSVKVEYTDGFNVSGLVDKCESLSDGSQPPCPSLVQAGVDSTGDNTIDRNATSDIECCPPGDGVISSNSQSTIEIQFSGGIQLNKDEVVIIRYGEIINGGKGVKQITAQVNGNVKRNFEVSID